jgi:hypothetical protein
MSVLTELDHVRSQGDFIRLVDLRRPKGFLFYSVHSEAKRMEMLSLLKHIGIERMDRWNCLDIGPGYGDSLDIWHELGASECAFIEREPVALYPQPAEIFHPRLGGKPHLQTQAARASAF